MKKQKARAGYGFIALFILIIAGGLIFTILDPSVNKVLNVADNQTANSRAQTSIDRTRTIWNLSLFYILFLGAIFIIARTLFETR